jgi:hypothetical protein
MIQIPQKTFDTEEAAQAYIDAVNDFFGFPIEGTPAWSVPRTMDGETWYVPTCVEYEEHIDAGD